MKIYIDPALVKEMPVLIQTPNRRRKRYPEGVISPQESAAAALAAADPAQNRHPALAVGPSRSSEGFRVYYLVRWLDEEVNPAIKSPAFRPVDV